MQESTKLLNSSRARLDELDQHLLECEGYVRRMLEIAVSRRPMHKKEDRVAREAFVALAELAEVRDRWKAALVALEQLATAADRLIAREDP